MCPVQQQIEPRERAGVWIALAVLAATLSGCREQPASRLIGPWEGRAETAADRAAGGAAPSNTRDAANARHRPGNPHSELEKFDFTIRLDFLDANQVRMTKHGGGGNQTLSGSWKIAETTPEAWTIEIVPAGNTPGLNHRPRRFTIRFSGHDPRRFTLSEVGADPSLGALVFRKIDE